MSDKRTDDLLIKIMENISNDVREIKTSMTVVSKETVRLRSDLDNHIKGSFTKTMMIVILIALVGIISGLMGYIWGLDNKNENKNVRQEKVHSIND